jgi:hypothetical protein
MAETRLILEGPHQSLKINFEGWGTSATYQVSDLGNRTASLAGENFEGLVAGILAGFADE